MVKMQGGVVLAAAIMLMAAAMAAAAAEEVLLTDKDLESEESMRSLYERWRRVYKSSRGLTEEESKFEAFKANAKYIHDFNKKTDVPYKLGLNEFSDLTLEEFTSMYTGAKPEAGDYKDDDGDGGSPIDGDMSSQQTTLASAVDDLPSAWDWRDHGAVTAVKNQGPCGSCWAFSVVASVESINAITTGKLLTLSEQQVLDCSGHGDCKAGATYVAFDYAISNGLAVDQSPAWNPPYYPRYGGKQETCRFDPNKPPVVNIDGKYRGKYADEAALKQGVLKQPVSVLIEASSSAFQSYKKGVFTGPCGTALNHAVLLVGYGTSTDGTKYWIVKNSWGETWGEQGYIRMKRDVEASEGLCGIAMYPMYATKNVATATTASY